MGLSKEQAEAIEIMRSGANVYLSGEGGTGKSFVIQHFLDSLSENDRGETLVLAPTGVAAKNINGVTVHRGLKLGTTPYGPDDEPPAKVPAALETATRIIIDEISMMRFDLFEYAAKCIKKAEVTYRKNIQLIVVGDFYQLPPVLTDKDLCTLSKLWGKEDYINYEQLKQIQKKDKAEYKSIVKSMSEDFRGGYAFMAPMWKEFNFTFIHLTEQHRQSGGMELVDHLNLLRKSISDDEKSMCIEYFNSLRHDELDNGVSIVPTNNKADNLNDSKIDELILDGAEFNTYAAIITGEVSAKDKPNVDDNLKLCVGAKVMSVINDSEKGIVNGDTGIITGIKDNKVTVLFDNGKRAVIEPYEWSITDIKVVKDKKTGKNRMIVVEIGTYTQLPLRVAYAITVHKSQGMTFDSINLHTGFFAPGQCYVGASRVRSADGLAIIGKLKKSDIITSVAVRSFYDSSCTELATIYPTPGNEPVQLETEPVKPVKKDSIPPEPVSNTDNDVHNESLDTLEKRLEDLMSNSKSRWTAIYAIMKEISTKKLFLGAGYKSFTAWLNDFSNRIGKGKALLWREKRAGDIYETYKESNPDAPDLTEINVSPDNLELAAKIAPNDIPKQHNLIDRIVSGELKNKALRQIYKGDVQESAATLPSASNEHNTEPKAATYKIRKSKGKIQASLSMPVGMDPTDFEQRIAEFCKSLNE